MRTGCFSNSHAKAAREATDNGDDGTNDLLVSQIIRTNKMQVWFLSEHLVATPLMRPGAQAGQKPRQELAPKRARPSPPNPGERRALFNPAVYSSMEGPIAAHLRDVRSAP